MLERSLEVAKRTGKILDPHVHSFDVNVSAPAVRERPSALIALVVLLTLVRVPDMSVAIGHTVECFAA